MGLTLLTGLETAEKKHMFLADLCHGPQKIDDPIHDDLYEHLTPKHT